MKLSELVYPKTLNSRINKDFDIDKLSKIADRKMAGGNAGINAYGNINPKDPHEFEKKTYLPIKLQNDGYYQYVTAIAPYIESNIFLPRVYVVEIVSDSSGQVIPKYKIEALHKPEEFSDESITGLANQVFDKTTPLIGGEKAWKIIAERLRRAFVGAEEIEYLTSNKQLIQAVGIIRKLLKENRSFYADMHTGNIMIRGTSVGPQLVITDPLGQH